MKKPVGNITIVIPAFNEEKTVRRVAKIALKTQVLEPRISEIIVVNDGSKDDTVGQVKDLPIRVVTHKKNKGYTAALQTGITETKTEFVCIIDADWSNITVEAIHKIISPLLDGKADLVKASFERARGRVTNYAVKPMMQILYPDYHFEQPISGQFAGRTDFFETVSIETTWGIAIGILLEAIQKNLRVIEVNVGKLVHKAHNDEDIARMAKEVLETMIEKSGLIRHKYKLIVFNIDDPIINTNSFKKVLKELDLDTNNFEKKVGAPGADEESEKILSVLSRNAKKFSDRCEADVIKLSNKIHIPKYSKEVFDILKKRRFKTAIITSNYSPVAKSITERLGVDYLESVELKVKKGVLTGELTEDSLKKWGAENTSEVFLQALKRISKKAKVSSSEIILVVSSPKTLEIIKKVGLSIAYRPTDQDLRKYCDKTIKILPEILAIVE